MLIHAKGNKSERVKNFVQSLANSNFASFVSPDKFDPRSYTYVANDSISLEVDQPSHTPHDQLESLRLMFQKWIHDQ